MNDSDVKKLNIWINNLSEEKLKKVIETCVIELSYNESVRVSEEGKPYWTSCGDYLDE